MSLIVKEHLEVCMPTQAKKKGTKMSLADAGRKGGQVRAKKYSKEELSKQAKKGARTIEKQRPGFHSQIGKKGGEARGRR
jgi:general stress protein YciG